jgi:Transposase
MIHVGVDLHQRFCYMTALEARGKVIEAGPVSNEKQALRRYFRRFRGQSVQVAVEACGFWPGFREVVEPEVKRLVLVHPQRVKAIASAKLKNDRVDSATLAHLLRCDWLPESWKADRDTQARRQQVRLRTTLVRQRTRLKNQVHALLHQQGLRSPVSDLFGRRGRAVVARGEVAGTGARQCQCLPANDRSLQRRNSKAKPATKRKSKKRPAGAVADDDSWNWRVFGDDAVGRDRRGAAFFPQRSTMQLCWTGAADTGIGGQSGACWDHATGIEHTALDYGRSGTSGHALVAGGARLLPTAAAEKAQARSPGGAGPQVVDRRLCPVARRCVV